MATDLPLPLNHSFAGKTSMPVQVLSYYMKVKHRHLLYMTYSCVTGKKDQWSAGSAVSEMTTECPSTYGLLCQGCRRWTQLSAIGVYHW